MALHPVRGVLAVENSQTGDGRVLAEGCLEWQDPPLPLAWIRDGDQHTGLTEVAPTIGNILTIAMEGTECLWTGVVDDEIPDGAEVLARMDRGTASHGARWGLSIDPDNWEVQIILTNPEDVQDEEVILVASGQGQPMTRLARVLLSAAGDPDPDPTTTEVLFEDNVDSILERYTRLRIRGATLCAVQAFTEGWMERDTTAAEPEDDAEPEVEDDTEEPEAEALAAAAVVNAHPLPPASAFQVPEPDVDSGLLVEQVDAAGNPVALACPLTVVGRQVFGHLAFWGQCHIGYPGVCISPPSSALGYTPYYHGPDHFMRTGGGVLCQDGSRVPAGPVTAGTDHAVAQLRAPEARDHYAHTGLQWADIAVTDGIYGPWACGWLRDDVTDEQVQALMSGGWSGDWREIGGHLELIGVLAITTAGFPLQRNLAASALTPVVGMAQGEQISLVAAGVVHRCPDCARRQQLRNGADAFQAGLITEARFMELLGMVAKVEQRTRHLVPVQASADLHALED